MGKISEQLGIPDDVLEGATIVNHYGNCLIVENFRSLIEFTPERIKIMGKKQRVLVHGYGLMIKRFTKEDCKIMGQIEQVEFEEEPI